MRGRVLIVDDEPLIRECLGAILAAESFEVQAVSSAAAAIVALGEGEFDLVITDMAMETETAGWDVVRAARQQSYHPHPEVVILTGAYVPATEWKGKGVKHLFTKTGGTPGTLLKAVKAIFEKGIRAPLAIEIS
jgi:CheY-like chemotaxis protein